MLRKNLLFVVTLLCCLLSFATNKKKVDQDGVVIRLHDLKPSKKPLKMSTLEKAFRKTSGQSDKIAVVTAEKNELLTSKISPLVTAVHYAYARHLPLSLTPDVIWQAICQGVSRHINENSEKFRRQIVSFDGRKVIRVRVDALLDEPESEFWWATAVSDLSQKVKENTKEEYHDKFVTDYSTTNKWSTTSFQATMLESVDKFFYFQVESECGIPYVNLKGKVEDWQKIREKVEGFREFELGWWIDELIPVLDQFVMSAKGKADKKFWCSIYKPQEECDMPGIKEGWLLKFYPYLLERKNVYFKNPNILKPERQRWICLNKIPGGCSIIPFRWNIKKNGSWYYYKMGLYAGLLGVMQDKETQAVQPAFGWAVLYKSKTARPDRNRVVEN